MACKLSNSSPIEIMACRNSGLNDPDYGLEYMISLWENPWVYFCTADGSSPCTRGTPENLDYRIA